MPHTLAVCHDPPTVVLEFVGDSYDKHLEKCKVGGFLESLVSITARLEEMHGARVVHNDLKVSNITFSGGHDKPVFHITDLGLSCRAREVADCYVKEENKDMFRWIAPEVKTRRPVYPSGDVHGFGTLVEYALEQCDKELLKEDLKLVIAACIQRESSRRPP